MKKKVFIAVVLIVVLLVGGFLFFHFKSNNKPKEYEGKITSMKLYIDNHKEIYYHAELHHSKDRVFLDVREKKMEKLDRRFKRRLTDKNLETIRDVINENKIYEWDGFNKGDKDNLKGQESFTLEITFSDKRTLKVYGYGKYPEKYTERKKALRDCIEKLIRI